MCVYALICVCVFCISAYCSLSVFDLLGKLLCISVVDLVNCSRSF